MGSSISVVGASNLNDWLLEVIATCILCVSLPVHHINLWHTRKQQLLHTCADIRNTHHNTHTFKFRNTAQSYVCMSPMTTDLIHNSSSSGWLITWQGSAPTAFDISHKPLYKGTHVRSTTQRGDVKSAFNHWTHTPCEEYCRLFQCSDYTSESLIIRTKCETKKHFET